MASPVRKCVATEAIRVSLLFYAINLLGVLPTPAHTPNAPPEGAQVRKGPTAVARVSIRFIAFQVTCVIPVAALCWSIRVWNLKTAQFRYFFAPPKNTSFSFPAKGFLLD